MSDDKLRFTTLALRRELASEHVELSPVVLPGVIAYGDEDRAPVELSLALSELPTEARPATVARLLLPDGVRLEQVEVQVGRTELDGRLGRKFPITLTVAVVPEPREAADPAGHWVFVPVLDHAIYVARKEKLADRLAAELAVLPTALALSLDGWRRLITHAPAELMPIDVELATTPLAEALGKKSLADAERRRQALIALDGAGRRFEPSGTPRPVVGRDELVADLGRVLGHGSRRSVLLVGDEAVGKSALVEAWANGSPNKHIWATSASELIAGASGLGEWQARVATVLASAETLDAVLYFEDFGALFADKPAEGGVDIAGAIRRHVVDGRVRVIGELTAAALDRAERRDVSLIGAMQRITVPATDQDTTIAACRAWAHWWAKHQPHRPQITADTIPIAVELARRFLPYRAFPGKAVRLLEELRASHDRGRDARGAGPVLGERELYAAFAWATGIPVALLDDKRPLARADVMVALGKRMVGQEPAVRRVADAICVAKARLSPGDKPLASLLFVGPSGVGKTELARSVAAYLFGAPDRMVRLDMSEYTDPWAAERLFGSGNDDGRLTSAVRSQPFGVVLLDEIEKAHPSVFDLLLQVLGEARLTDGRGRTTYFHNAIIVLTSNLGTRGAKGALGLGREEDPDRRYRDAVLSAFRPELINRLDQIVVFHPLEPGEIERVAEIAVARLAERRGLTQAGVLLDVTPAALAILADGGFAPDLGARALRRHLEAELLAPAARLLARAGSESPGRDADRARAARRRASRTRFASGTPRRADPRRAVAARRSDRPAPRAQRARARRVAPRHRSRARPARRRRRARSRRRARGDAREGHPQEERQDRAARRRDRTAVRRARAAVGSTFATCVAGQQDLRTAEELRLEALRARHRRGRSHRRRGAVAPEVPPRPVLAAHRDPPAAARHHAGRAHARRACRGRHVDRDGARRRRRARLDRPRALLGRRQGGVGCAARPGRVRGSVRAPDAAGRDRAHRRHERRRAVRHGARAPPLHRPRWRAVPRVGQPARAQGGVHRRGMEVHPEPAAAGPRARRDHARGRDERRRDDGDRRGRRAGVEGAAWPASRRRRSCA